MKSISRNSFGKSSLSDLHEELVSENEMTKALLQPKYRHGEGQLANSSVLVWIVQMLVERKKCGDLVCDH
jgi:hypothetical protein